MNYPDLRSVPLHAIPEYPVVRSQSGRERRTEPASFHYARPQPGASYPDLVVLDTETTGLSSTGDRIIELGAVRFQNGAPVARFQSLVDPCMPIPYGATMVNGITDEMVAGAPQISQILPSFEEFCGGAVILGHNLGFDLSFLYYSGAELFGPGREYIDTLQLARRMLKTPAKILNPYTGKKEPDLLAPYDVLNYKLGTLCSYYGVSLHNAHRADADAYATGLVFWQMLREL